MKNNVVNNLAKFRFLIIFVSIYFILSGFFLTKIDYFIPEQVVPLLTDYPKIIAEIDAKDGSNLYGTFFKGISPEQFKGITKQSGKIKTIFCTSVFPPLYYWILPNNSIVPIMQNKGVGMLYWHFHKFFFRDTYNFSSVKIHITLIGAFILIAMWIFLYYLIGSDVANRALAITSTAPLFLYKIEGLWFGNNYCLLFMLLGLVFLIKYKTTQKYFYLYIFSFLIGVNLYVKLTVLWMVVAGAILSLYYRLNLNIKLKHLFFSGLFVVLGSLPLILYNIDTQGGSLQGIKENFLRQGLLFHYWQGNFLLAITENFVYFVDFLMRNFPEQLLILLVTVVMFIYFRKSNLGYPAKKKITFLLGLPLLMFLLMLASAKKNDQYLTNLFPFFMMFQAAMLSPDSYCFKNDSSVVNKRLLNSILIGLIVFNLFIQFRKEAWLFVQIKGSKSAEETLVEYVNEKKLLPVTFEYGLVGTFEYLSKNKIRPLHYFSLFENLQNQTDKVMLIKNIILMNPGCVFVVKLDRYHEMLPGILHKDLYKLSQPSWYLRGFKALLFKLSCTSQDVAYKDFVDLSKKGNINLFIDKVIYNRFGECEYILIGYGKNCANSLAQESAVFLESPLW